MTIELKPEQERILREALRDGRFDSMDEALDAALRSISVPVVVPTGENRLTPTRAAARLRELRKGTVLPSGTTIRDLIEQGRA